MKVSVPNIRSISARCSGSSHWRPRIWLSWQANAAILRSATRKIGIMVVISSSGRASFTKASCWRRSSSVGGLSSPDRRRSASCAACMPAMNERGSAWW